MLVYVSWDSSTHIHKGNTPTDFTYELPFAFELGNKATCDLHEVFLEHKIPVRGKPKSKRIQDLYIYCDILEQSVVHGELKKLLRIVYRSDQNLKPTKCFVSTPCFNRMQFSIRNKDNTIPDLTDIDLNFCLLFSNRSL